MPDAYAYVRFSSPDQQHGDSFRRQWESIEQFVTARGLNLRPSHEFMDFGVSGYRGDNLKLKAGLGKFLKAVDDGVVQPGSYLIVESFDRLSRQNLVNSLDLLLSILRRQIKLVLLKDGAVQVLDTDADIAQFFMTMTTMSRAHDESRQKSQRGKAVWRNKKENAGDRPVSSRCPEWLTYDKNTGRFEQVPERVTTIQKIFELADQGIGRHRILRYLNANNYKSFRNEANGWQSSSIGKLLRNKSLIGSYFPASVEYDPETGKESRVSDGIEHPNYYPVVIDVGLFNRVASRAQLRAIPLRGRQGPALTNLFTGMAFCWWCGASMSLCNKGKPPKGGRYLVCSKAARGKGCAYRAWRYEDVELYVLAKLREIDIASVMGETSLTKDISDVRTALAGAHEEIAACERKLSKFQSALNEDEEAPPEGFLKMWRKEEAKLHELRVTLDKLCSQEQMLVQRVEDPVSFGEQLVKLYEAMDTLDEEQKYLVRVRLRERLTVLIKRIAIRPLRRDESRWHDGAPRDRLISIEFRNGAVRSIIPIGKNDVFSLDSKRPPAAGDAAAVAAGAT